MWSRSLSHSRKLTTTRLATCCTNSVCRSTSTSVRHNSTSTSPYISAMYQQWSINPQSVSSSWDIYFKSGQYVGTPIPSSQPKQEASVQPSAPPSAAPSTTTNADTAKVVQLVRAFQVRGHLLANLDPLGLMKIRPDHDDLSLESYGFTDADLNRVIDLSGLASETQGFLTHKRGSVTLKEIYTRLKETYCGNIGYEYMHIPSVEKCNFMREQIESYERRTLTPDMKWKILNRLAWADHFEGFLHKKYGKQKRRFGLEGAESTIVACKAIIDESSELGVSGIVMGMPHRGRLNVLASVVRKPIEQIFQEFDERDLAYHDQHSSGDVKYHLGMSFERPVGPHKRPMHISLLANPSHLEAVNPVVAGKTRAKQFYWDDKNRDKVLPLLLHGDAAFAGQGIVYELLSMSKLTGYEIGGTIHIVVNNQIGFTTDPHVGRSSPYSTDIAKMGNIPIFHVNGDDPEAVHHVGQVASQWRKKFKTDVVIDLVCYRRHGHNEGDEPEFTQPEMYHKIANHPSAFEIYKQKLIAEGVVTKQQVDELSTRIYDFLKHSYEDADNYRPKPRDSAKKWLGLMGKQPTTDERYQETGVPIAQLQSLGQKLATVPSDINIHPRIKNIYDQKAKAMASGKDLDWAAGEALAFATLLMEGKHVRLSGQDVQRGTFSHRHSVLHEQKAFRPPYIPLANLSEKQAPISIYNSNLTEYATLGFETGYSLENPHQLVLWEAQFGDFFNGAQVIVDQFISSEEAKWLRQNGIVMLLPHGYEGQGPEHSSARIERFLQNSDDHADVLPSGSEEHQIHETNWQVVNLTTPANYFHALRRQLHRSFRKPLIMFSPKSLLKHKSARSTFEEMGPGTTFTSVYPEMDKSIITEKVKRVVYCSGKVYYDLIEERSKKIINNVAIIRVEQLTPFPFHRVAEEAQKYNLSAEIVWCQEEPMNMGAWTYVEPRFATALKSIGRPTKVTYVGRDPAAATATGSHDKHDRELETFLYNALH